MRLHRVALDEVLKACRASVPSVTLP